jgi:hypothetical protein
MMEAGMLVAERLTPHGLELSDFHPPSIDA